MKKKVIIKLGFCLMISIGLVVVLFTFSNTIIHKRNDFLRVFPPHPIRKENVLNIKFNSYYIAGLSQHRIYLGNGTAPLHVLDLNMSLQDSTHITLKIEGINQDTLASTRIEVNPPYFYVFDGIVPLIYKGPLDTWIATKYITAPNHFTIAEPTVEKSIVFRAVNSSSKNNMLGTFHSDTLPTTFNTTLLEKQIDGFFCTDGQLDFNTSLNQIIYTYYYRNQFLVLNTDLTIKLKGKTIDTVSIAQLKIANTNGIKTMAAPPLIVNKRSTTYGNWLFVQSNLLAKNEHRKLFDDASVIDVYNLKNGHYKMSFYIPNFENHRIKDFKIIQDKLVTLYEHHIVVYTIGQEYLNT